MPLTKIKRGQKKDVVTHESLPEALARERCLTVGELMERASAPVEKLIDGSF